MLKYLENVETFMRKLKVKIEKIREIKQENLKKSKEKISFYNNIFHFL